jgi:hypothetical protein
VGLPFASANQVFMFAWFDSLSNYLHVVIALLVYQVSTGFYTSKSFLEIENH